MCVWWNHFLSPKSGIFLSSFLPVRMKLHSTFELCHIPNCRWIVWQRVDHYQSICVREKGTIVVRSPLRDQCIGRVMAHLLFGTKTAMEVEQCWACLAASRDHVNTLWTQFKFIGLFQVLRKFIWWENIVVAHSWFKFSFFQYITWFKYRGNK